MINNILHSLISLSIAERFWKFLVILISGRAYFSTKNLKQLNETDSNTTGETTLLNKENLLLFKFTPSYNIQ